MQALTQVRAVQEPAPSKSVSRWDAFFGDLDLFISVAIARLIVWTTLRKRRRERTARLKQFTLVHGGNDRVEGNVSP